MRELVYLSRRKLAQFQPERPRGGFLSRVRGIRAKAPLSLGEVSLTLAGPASQDVPHLDQVLDELNNRVRGVRWFEDGELHAGDWVQFEAPMNYAVLEQTRSAHGGLLLFWEPHRENATTNGPAASFVLHASAGGIVGTPENSLCVRNSDSMSGPDVLGKALRQLSSDVHMDEFNWGRALDSILDELDREYPPFMASWLAGYARVTGIAPATARATSGYILATPLYVERVPEPEDD